MTIKVLLITTIFFLLTASIALACVTPPQCEVDCQPQESPSPSPSQEPSSTPSPTEPPHQDTFSQPDPQGPPADIACEKIEFTPTVNLIERLSPTEVKVGWTLTAPVDDYRIFYGLSEDNLGWSVGVENTHEVVLGNLPANHYIFVQVFPTDGHCLGKGSAIIDP